MLTKLFNHLIGVWPSQSTRDNRGGLVKTIGPTAKTGQSSVPGRVEIYSPRNISRQMVFQLQSRQIYIDHIIYTEATDIGNGDFIKWLPSAGANQYFRVEAVVEFSAQGTVPTYYEIGALEIKI